VDGNAAESAHDRPPPPGEEGMLAQPMHLDAQTPCDGEHEHEVPIGGVRRADEDGRSLRCRLGDELPPTDCPEGAGDEASDHALDVRAPVCANPSASMCASRESEVCREGIITGRSSLSPIPSFTDSRGRYV